MSIEGAAVGVTVPRPQWTAALIHLPLTLGTLTLAGAFLLSIPLGFQIASGLLGLGFGVALIAFTLAVWRAPVTSGTVIAVLATVAAAHADDATFRSATGAMELPDMP